MTFHYVPKVSRRSTLQWLAATGLISAIPRYAHGANGRVAAFKAASKGYGTDPDLTHPVVPWTRTLTQRQLQLTAVLADLILPGSDSAPAPSMLGIPDFVDEWVSAPYPEQQMDRAIILEGLECIDAEAGRRWRKTFLEIDDAARQTMVSDIAGTSDRAAFAAQNTFFPRFRYVVVGAYYTTPEGFKDIGYIGNVPLESYPHITDEEKQILERELSKLGLSRS